MTAPYLLSDSNKTDFPNVELALREPDGLLAIGGDLSTQRLLAAYQQGIFPWYSEGQPPLWWSPDPRMVITPSEIKISRSLAKKIRKQDFKITFDHDFHHVIRACSKPRMEKGMVQDGTWILEEMIEAYINLYNAGHAHSVEFWQNDKLLGGLYGIVIGKVFFGESMFSKISDASKIAFSYLCVQLKNWHFELIDCQVYSAHLASLGAYVIPRKKFLSLLQMHTIENETRNSWNTLAELNASVRSFMENKNER